MPLETVSGRFSEDCERFRAFWADPRMPSRLKLGVRADLRAAVGDFNELTPLVEVASWGKGEGISIEKSRVGRGYCLTALALAPTVAVIVPAPEWGESPFDDGMRYS